jgi:aspartyl-tRNA(Asn)/glutamyl-tRNA(Gln) amidotransferase subunit B
VIGHGGARQVASKSKLFSGASTEFGAEPNSHVSLVDAAMPGMLPVINEECVAQAVRTGLGLKAADQPALGLRPQELLLSRPAAGLSDLQYKQPIVGEGEVDHRSVPTEGEPSTVGIERLHLEQDAGKSMHDQHPDHVLVDLNRSGVALMEIVSKPDMRSPTRRRPITKLRTILRYLGTCDGDMEKGNLRADVNVSVRKPGGEFGTRCEIKNVNSIRFIGQAIEYEARRQIGIIEDGGTIDQETRLFDAAKGETRSMRSKEEAHDYRYFPDPDLLPLEFDQAYVDELKAGLPELPDEKKERFMKDFGLSPYDAERAGRRAGDRRLLRGGRQGPRRQECRQLGDQRAVRAAQQGRQGTSRSRPVSPAQLGGIVDLIGRHDFRQDRQGPVRDRLDRGRRPAEIVEKRGMKQVTDTGAIEKAVDEIIAANPDKVEQALAKPTLHRLVRRPGDEVDRRQGQSAGGERRC